MNLLIISNNPDRASFRQRIGIYLDTLYANGVNCQVAKFPKSSLQRWKFFRQAAGFDAVFLHKKRLNCLDAILARRYCKKIIYDFDDAVMYDPNIPESNSFTHYNPFCRTVKIADLVIAGNNYLAEHALKFSPNVKILPTGLDIDSYNVKSDEENDGRIRLVWIGSKSTLPYLMEIKPALEKVGLRFDNIVLRIICDDFFELQNMDVEKCLWQKDTEVTNLVTSNIGLSPLSDNRFTKGKCGFKILQYMAAGLPVVASPVGTNSDYVLDNVTGFLATDIDEWIDKITQLVENRQLRKRMGREGLAQAKKFDQSVIGKQLVELITECLRNDT